MNTPRKTTDAGRTGFWMRCDSNLNVRVVNGTMYKLLNAKDASTLTHILSYRFARQSLRSKLYAKRCNRKADNRNTSYPRVYGLIGLQASYTSPAWESSIKLQRLKTRRAQADTSLNTYSSLPFSQIVGLKDGSALDTLKDFQDRRKPTAGQ